MCRRSIPTFMGLALLITLSFLGGCEGCTQAPPDVEDAGEPAGGVDPEPGVRTCVVDGDCEGEGLCQGGICTQSDIIDAGTLTDGGNTAPEDAGPAPIGRLQVLPDALVEFGAQRLGIPVERDVVVVNVGNAPLTVLTVVLNNNEQSEFAASPVGNIGQELLPAEQLTFRVSHTPVDGRPDEGELNVLHTGFGNLTTVTFLAEFKGDPAFNVNDDVTAIMDNVSELFFGEVASDQTVTKRLFLRNTGRSDSLLEITDLTLTPAEGDFSLDTEVELPVLLSSWASGLCPDDTVDECPEGTDACTDQICVGANGDPVNALVVELTFTPGIAPATATFTIDTNFEAGTAFDVVLNGTPTQPNALLTPTELQFGPTLVGATPGEMSFQLENIGEGPLYITKVEFPAEMSAFVLEFNAPVPTLDGHPPLTLQPNAPALVGTVTFTPSAAEGYTGFVTVYTNDADQLTLPIGLSGTGVVCPANSEVNANGECVCSVGFNDCNGECVGENTLTACGASCMDCTAANIGDGTDATCSAGQCEYSCLARWYDLDSDIDDATTTPGWDGCEYACPQHPALQFEFCNGVDDNCDGQTDEGMPPDADDIAGSNETCVTGKDLLEVSATTSGATNVFTRSIYPAGDDDWFFITVKEGSDSPNCVSGDNLSCIQGGYENYRTDFSLSSPTGADYTMDIIAIESFSAYTGDQTVGCGESIYQTGVSVSHAWTRFTEDNFLAFLFCANCLLGGDETCDPRGYGCGFDDYQKYAIRVHPKAGTTPSSCENYTLTVVSTATGSGEP